MDAINAIIEVLHSGLDLIAEAGTVLLGSAELSSTVEA